MSLKYVPNYVWYPIAVLLWVFVMFVFLLMLMSYRAKSFEIQLFSLAIRVQEINKQIDLAQGKVTEAINVISNVSSQLTIYQGSLSSTGSQRQVRSTGVPEGYSKSAQLGSEAVSFEGGHSGVPGVTIDVMQVEKARLEGVSRELKNVQGALRINMPKSDASSDWYWGSTTSLPR